MVTGRYVKWQHVARYAPLTAGVYIVTGTMKKASARMAVLKVAAWSLSTA
jgi:hypothetical protein